MPDRTFSGGVWTGGGACDSHFPVGVGFAAVISRGQDVALVGGGERLVTRHPSLVQKNLSKPLNGQREAAGTCSRPECGGEGGGHGRQVPRAQPGEGGERGGASAWARGGVVSGRGLLRAGACLSHGCSPGPELALLPLVIWGLAPVPLFGIGFVNRSLPPRPRPVTGL